MSSGFVTEAELEEKKLKRQEEWEKVRKPEDPQDAPEELVDNRSLFDRLEEQRQKKQEEWDEEHQFKNQVRGLDDEEFDFLGKIDDIRTEAERKRMTEERKELEDYQIQQEQLREQQLQERLRHELKGPEIRRNNSINNALKPGGGKSKQQQLLLGAVKRKSGGDTNISVQPKVAKLSTGEESIKSKDIKKPATNNKDNGEAKQKEESVIKLPVAAALKLPAAATNSLTAIQGLMAAYSDSESDNEEDT